MDNRQQFADAVAEVERLRQLASEQLDQAEVLTARVGVYRKGKLRKAPWTDVLAQAPAGLQAEVAELRAAIALRDEQRPVADAVADDAALLCTPQAGTLQVVLADVSSSTYRTVGMGADSYAKADAEGRADVARMHGIGVAVVKACRVWEGSAQWYAEHAMRDVNGNPIPAEHTATWHVVVYVAEPLDAELLRRLPGPGLVERVRLAWARGVNPRVMMPRLPHGFEERHGLDFFGGYKGAA